ncbi:MAG TPA: hypothetical protein VIL86_16160 [Tepidisphaeraceae bacterium]
MTHERTISNAAQAEAEVLLEGEWSYRKPRFLVAGLFLLFGLFIIFDTLWTWAHKREHAIELAGGVLCILFGGYFCSLYALDKRDRLRVDSSGVSYKKKYWTWTEIRYVSAKQIPSVDGIQFVIRPKRGWWDRPLVVDQGMTPEQFHEFGSRLKHFLSVTAPDVEFR